MRNGENEKIVDRCGFFGMGATENAPGAEDYPHQGQIECAAHIERFAYIENPTRDLYRVYLDSSASFTADRVMPRRMKKANMTLG